MNKKILSVVWCVSCAAATAAFGAGEVDWSAVRRAYGAFLEEPVMDRAMEWAAPFPGSDPAVADRSDPEFLAFEEDLAESLDLLEYQMVIGNPGAIRMALRILAIRGLDPQLRSDLEFSSAKRIRIDPDQFLEEAAAFTVDESVPPAVAANARPDRHGRAFALYELKKRRESLMTVTKGRVSEVRQRCADAIWEAYDAVDRGDLSAAPSWQALRGAGDALEAVEALHEADIRASKAGDFEALRGLLDDEGVILPPLGSAVRGHEALDALYEEWGEAHGGVEVVAYEQDFEEVVLTGGYAFEWGRMSGSERMPDGSTAEQRFHLLRILRRQEDGSWKVYRAIWNQAGPEEGGAGAGSGR